MDKLQELLEQETIIADRLEILELYNKLLELDEKLAAMELNNGLLDGMPV